MTEIKVNLKPSNSGKSNHPIYYAFIARMGNNYAKRFYDTFPSDFQISIKQAEIINPPTYLGLLKRINSVSERNILIFTHGNDESGMTSFKFRAGKRNVISTWEGLFCILHYAAVKRIFSRIKFSKNSDDWTDVLNLITKYNNTYNAETTLQALKDLGLYNNNQKEFSDICDEIKKFKGGLNEKNTGLPVKAWTQKIRKFQKGIRNKLRVTPSLMNEYVEQISEIQNKKLINLAIRGCNIGNNESILEIYSMFFNVQNINAPKVKLFMGILNISIFRNQTILSGKIKKKYTELFGTETNPDPLFGGGTRTKTIEIKNLQGRIIQKRVGHYYNPLHLNKGTNKDELFISLKINLDNSTGQGRIIAEHNEIIETFAQESFGRTNRRINKEMPVYFLPQTPPIFPQDIEFENYISRKTFRYYNFINDYR
jgi:hypothetical protein